MTRFTDKLRVKTGVRDGDPVAPVFDAIDDLNVRVVVAEAGYDAAGTREADIRRKLTRDSIRVGLVVSAAATGLAIAASAGLLRAGEDHIAGQVRALDQERTRSFNARVEKRASELAFTAVTDANNRATSAEALLAIAQDKVVALASSAGSQARDLLKLASTASREDVAVLLNLQRHKDQNVRRVCGALTEASPATIGMLLDHFIANKGKL
ncbi:hypothetical protein [Bosea sp. R86505]|uniref:hypothetical protein n=1 Tax=Bosea sp. R86505 TaxID=3101710 RepID=UPI003673203E